MYCIGSKPPPLPQQIRASHDLGFIFQLNGGRALRGTLVAGVRSTLKQVGHYAGGRLQVDAAGCGRVPRGGYYSRL